MAFCEAVRYVHLGTIAGIFRARCRCFKAKPSASVLDGKCIGNNSGACLYLCSLKREEMN